MIKKTIIVAAITISACLVVLLTFEFFLRKSVSYITNETLEQTKGVVQFDPEFLVEYKGNNRRLRPNVKVLIHNHYLSGKDVSIQTNSFGFRGEGLEEKKDNELRILFLGDSITIGDYLNQEEVFPWITQSILQSQIPTKSISIAVAALTNLGLDEEVSLLKESGLATKPDIVVLNFYLNDSRPPWGFSGETGNRGWLRKRSLLAETIYTRLIESNWKDKQRELRFSWIDMQNKLDWQNNKSDFLKLANSAKYDWGAAWDESSWVVVENGFKELKNLADEFNFKVFIAIHPVSFQVYANFIEETPQQKLKEISNLLKFTSIDLLPILRTHKKEDLFYDQCHPKAFTNKLIAKEIAENLNIFN